MIEILHLFLFHIWAIDSIGNTECLLTNVSRKQAFDFCPRKSRTLSRLNVLIIHNHKWLSIQFDFETPSKVVNRWHISSSSKSYIK